VAVADYLAANQASRKSVLKEPRRNRFARPRFARNNGGPSADTVI